MAAYLQSKLAQRLQEQITFNITHRTTDFCDDDIAFLVLFRQIIQALLNLIGNVRDVLYSLAQIITTALFFQHLLKHFTAGQVVEARKLTMNESLVVPEVQIRLGSVIKHIHFAVLVRAHGAGVYVQVGVKLLHCYLQPAMLQQRTDGCCCKTFTERGYYTACYKNVLHACANLLLPTCYQNSG